MKESFPELRVLYVPATGSTPAHYEVHDKLSSGYVIRSAKARHLVSASVAFIEYLSSMPDWARRCDAYLRAMICAHKSKMFDGGDV